MRVAHLLRGCVCVLDVVRAGIVIWGFLYDGHIANSASKLNQSRTNKILPIERYFLSDSVTLTHADKRIDIPHFSYGNLVTLG